MTDVRYARFAECSAAVDDCLAAIDRAAAAAVLLGSPGQGVVRDYADAFRVVLVGPADGDGSGGIREQLSVHGEDWLNPSSSLGRMCSRCGDILWPCSDFRRAAHFLDAIRAALGVPSDQ